MHSCPMLTALLCAFADHMSWKKRRRRWLFWVCFKETEALAGACGAVTFMREGSHTEKLGLITHLMSHDGCCEGCY